MNWKKIIILLLMILLFVQLQIFGLDNCSKCSFGEEKLSMKQFFSIYNDECLTQKNEIEFSDNFSVKTNNQIENE